MISPCLHSSQPGSLSVSPLLPCSKGSSLPFYPGRVLGSHFSGWNLLGAADGRGSRPDHKLGLSKRDHFHEVQGKMNPLTMGESRKGLWRNGEGEGGTPRGGSGGWRGEGVARCV